MSVSAMQLYFSQYQSPMETRGPMNFIFPDQPVRPRVTREAEDIYRKHRQGTGVAEIFGGALSEWVPIHNPAWARRKKKTINHLTNNKTNIKKIEETVQSAQKELELKQREELNKPLWKSEKYNGIQSKVAEHIKSYNDAGLALPIKTGRSKSVEPGINQNGGVQGKIINPQQEVKGITNNPIIHNPRGNIVEPNRHGSGKNRSTSAKRSSSAQRQEPKNFMHLNLHSAGKTPEKRSRSATALDNLQKKQEDELKKHKAGEVPSYLRERKLVWQKQNEKKPYSDCPPGHVIMPAEEKQKTLEKLKTAEQDILSRLNHLPVRTDTTFLVRKKGEYQKKLDEVEEAIKIFSKPKVFIRQDSNK